MKNFRKPIRPSIGPSIIRASSRALHRNLFREEFRRYSKNSQTFRLTIGNTERGIRVSHEPARLQHIVHFPRTNLSICYFSSRHSPTFNVDLVNVLYISVFYMDDWGISGDGGVISVDDLTELLRYLVPPTRHCLPRCPKVYRIIDISRVCEFYIIRIAFAW